MTQSQIDITAVPIMPNLPAIPHWEHRKANFDTEYSKLKKNENDNLLVNLVKEHLDTSYSSHLRIFTDGSVLDSSDSGAGFVIPHLKMKRSFYLGRGFSIFTAELYALIMALNYVSESPFSFYAILLCVDSKSVLHALQNWDSAVRRDMIYEIKYLVHCIRSRGIAVDFCWVPSHCGLHWNEVCDGLAKQGAMRSEIAELNTHLKLSNHELISLLEKSMQQRFILKRQNATSFCSRYFASLIYRLRCNAWKTKYVPNVVCICSQQISVHHIIFECPSLTAIFQDSGINVKDHYDNVIDLLSSSSDILMLIMKLIANSPVGKLL